MKCIRNVTERKVCFSWGESIKDVFVNIRRTWTQLWLSFFKYRAWWGRSASNSNPTSFKTNPRSTMSSCCRKICPPVQGQKFLSGLTRIFWIYPRSEDMYSPLADALKALIKGYILAYCWPYMFKIGPNISRILQNATLSEWIALLPAFWDWTLIQHIHQKFAWCSTISNHVQRISVIWFRLQCVGCSDIGKLLKLTFSKICGIVEDLKYAEWFSLSQLLIDVTLKFILMIVTWWLEKLTVECSTDTVKCTREM